MFIIRFIFRWIKRLIFLVGLGTVIWWGYQYMQPESPLRQKVDKIRQSGIVQEGAKDIKTWGGEIYKGVSNKAVDEITKEDKRKLDEILARELGAKKKK